MRPIVTNKVERLTAEPIGNIAIKTAQLHEHLDERLKELHTGYIHDQYNDRDVQRRRDFIINLQKNIIELVEAVTGFLDTFNELPLAAQDTINYEQLVDELDFFKESNEKLKLFEDTENSKINRYQLYEITKPQNKQFFKTQAEQLYQVIAQPESFEDSGSQVIDGSLNLQIRNALEQAFKSSYENPQNPEEESQVTEISNKLRSQYGLISEFITENILPVLFEVQMRIDQILEKEEAQNEKEYLDTKFKEKAEQVKKRFSKRTAQVIIEANQEEDSANTVKMLLGHFLGKNEIESQEYYDDLWEFIENTLGKRIDEISTEEVGKIERHAKGLIRAIYYSDKDPALKTKYLFKICMAHSSSEKANYIINADNQDDITIRKEELEQFIQQIYDCVSHKHKSFKYQEGQEDKLFLTAYKALKTISSNEKFLIKATQKGKGPRVAKMIDLNAKSAEKKEILYMMLVAIYAALSQHWREKKTQ